MEPAILIPMTAVRRMSPSTQKELLSFVGITSATADSGPKVPHAEEDGPVELTVSMIRKITSGLGDKTTSALKVIAQSETNEFRQEAVVAAVDGAKVYGDLRGVWSALTRRTRNVINDPEAEVIWWDEDSIYDDDGEYQDHVGRVSRLTHASLKTHFGF